MNRRKPVRAGKSARAFNGEDGDEASGRKVRDSTLPRKASKCCNRKPTVPQTDTGRRGEYPKALERTLVQELGKLAP